jgi:hypothetical protein
MYLSWHKTGPYPTTKSSGTRARGITYERRVGRLLRREAAAIGADFRDHEWLRLQPESSPALADAQYASVPSSDDCLWLQPDFVIDTPGGLLLFEAKLTFCEAAFDQLERYKRVLTQYGRETRPITPVLVCRNLTPSAPEPITRFDDVVPWAVWHLFL